MAKIFKLVGLAFILPYVYLCLSLCYQLRYWLTGMPYLAKNIGKIVRFAIS